ncbi:MAG: STAS domain-containing protein [Methanothrix sp.]
MFCRRNGFQTVMKIAISEIEGIFIMAVYGRIDSNSSSEFERVLYETIDKTAWIILDLAEVEYISSSALRVLLAGKKRLKPKKGDLILTALQPVVRDVFEITGLSRVFSIQKSREQALQSIRSMQ